MGRDLLIGRTGEKQKKTLLEIAFNSRLVIPVEEGNEVLRFALRKGTKFFDWHCQQLQRPEIRCQQLQRPGKKAEKYKGMNAAESAGDAGDKGGAAR